MIADTREDEQSGCGHSKQRMCRAQHTATARMSPQPLPGTPSPARTRQRIAPKGAPNEEGAVLRCSMARIAGTGSAFSLRPPPLQAERSRDRAEPPYTHKVKHAHMQPARYSREPRSSTARGFTSSLPPSAGRGVANERQYPVFFCCSLVLLLYVTPSVAFLMQQTYQTHAARSQKTPRHPPAIAAPTLRRPVPTPTVVQTTYAYNSYIQKEMNARFKAKP